MAVESARMLKLNVSKLDALMTIPSTNCTTSVLSGVYTSVNVTLTGAIGIIVGTETTGTWIGLRVGFLVGRTVGLLVGVMVGIRVGALVGPIVTLDVGTTDESSVGEAVGPRVGRFDGIRVGL